VHCEEQAFRFQPVSSFSCFFLSRQQMFMVACWSSNLQDAIFGKTKELEQIINVLHHLVHKVCCLKILLPSFDNAELLLTARFVLHVKRITKLHLRIATASEVSISPPGNNKFLNMKVFYLT